MAETAILSLSKGYLSKHVNYNKSIERATIESETSL